MSYLLNLSSPQTYEIFKQSTQKISGFPIRQKRAAERVKPGDTMLCYMTGISRWFGALDVISGPTIDDAPIYSDPDPYVIRFEVQPIVLLEIDQAIPIRDDTLWKSLSFTRNHDKKSSTWTAKLRSSLTQLDDEDGQLLFKALKQQTEMKIIYPLDHKESERLKAHTVRRADRIVSVSVPADLSDEDVTDQMPSEPEVRESIRVQALIADIGAQMGLRIWIPRGDLGAVVREAPTLQGAILERLPLNYDDVTLRTIEQIDVLWLRGRSIIRAFEVEHTTSIYSGILRMADLLALQPNMDIKLHIVAPLSKRDKVFHEIRRPVFSLLDGRPLSETCTYLSYDSLRELAEQKHLAHLSDSVIEEYDEKPE